MATLAPPLATPLRPLLHAVTYVKCSRCVTLPLCAHAVPGVTVKNKSNYNARYTAFKHQIEQLSIVNLIECFRGV